MGTGSGDKDCEKTMKTCRAKTLVLVLAGLIVLGFGPHSLAGPQDVNQPKDLFEMPLDDLMEVEVDTVYAASKYTQKVTKAPSLVTIITADEIRKYGYRTLLDILQSVPGFYETYDRNYGYVGVRGFGRPGDYNSRILVLIDGHRLNENVYDSFGAGTTFPLDVDLIKKIEIVRGPGSALYGSNALFAVINVITKNGQDYRGLELSGELGSLDTERSRATYGNVFDNGLNLLISGTYYDRDGETLYYREFDDPSTNNGRVRNDDDGFKSFFVKTSISDFTLTAAHVRREKGIPTAPWGTVFGDRGTRTWDYSDLIGLTYQHDFPDDLSIHAQLSYNRYDYHGDYVYDDGAGPYINKDSSIGDWWVSELQLTKKLSERHKLISGVEAQYNVRQDQKNWDTEVYLDKGESSKNWGLYVQDEFRLWDNLTLFAGLRRDYYDSIGETINPRAGLVYNPCEDTAIKLLFGRAFRAPSVYELYYEDGSTTKANPSLKPETIKTYEAVLEKNFNKNLRGSISGYYYKMQDLIDQTTDADGWIYFDNLNEVTATGIETALDAKWDNGVRGRVAYSHVQTLDKTTRLPLANSPEHMINFNLILPLIKDTLFAGIEAKYTSKRRTLAGRHTDDAVLTNLTLTYDNVVKRLELQVGIFNLFDEKYGYPGFAEHAQDIIDQDGRTIGLKLTYRF
jgi:outer membrane receptor protein involved in Fe transport